MIDNYLVALIATLLGACVLAIRGVVIRARRKEGVGWIALAAASIVLGAGVPVLPAAVLGWFAARAPGWLVCKLIVGVSCVTLAVVGMRAGRWSCGEDRTCTDLTPLWVWVPLIVLGGVLIIGGLMRRDSATGAGTA